MAVAVDASSPIRFAGVMNAGSSTTITSAAFTAPTDALIVVTGQFDNDTDAHFGAAPQISASDSGGLTWTERVRRSWDETTAGGASVIWTARTTSAVSRTVVLTRNGATGLNNSQASAKIYVLTGVDVDGTPVDSVGAGNENGSTTNSINTTSITPGADGLLIVSDCDWAAAGAFQASSDLTQDTDHYGGAISVCSGYKTCTSGVGVTGNLDAAGGGSVQHKWCQIIVRAPATAAGGVRALPSDGVLGSLFRMGGLV